MLAIEMRGISKRFGNFTANNDISLQIAKGEIHCLLGENGAGKSTLMNVLFGLYKPDSGEILINGDQVRIDNPSMAFKLGLGMVHQHFMLINNMTVLENIILGHEHGKLKLDIKRAHSEVQALSDKYNFQLDLDKKISELSVGMKQRVEILKTVYRGAEILILDEPTAVLTPQEVDSLLSILNDLRKESKTIIFITHKLKETMAVADTISILRSGEKVATLSKTDTTEEQLASLMVGREVNFNISKKAANFGDVMLDVKGIRLLPNAGNTISFQLRAGEIFGIAGVDGNGQQQLEEGIMGLYKFTEGDVLINGESIMSLTTKERKGRNIAYVPSDRLKRGIVPPFSVCDNYLLGNQYRKDYCKNGIISHKYLTDRAEVLIEQYNVKTSGLNQAIGSLSGGNQQKMVFSREVSENPTLVIVSQPVRGLDIGAIEYVHNILLSLRDAGKAILLISTELSEVMQLSDTIGVLYKGEFMDVRNAAHYTTQEIGLLMAGRRAGERYEQVT